MSIWLSFYWFRRMAIKNPPIWRCKFSLRDTFFLPSFCCEWMLLLLSDGSFLNCVCILFFFCCCCSIDSKLSRRMYSLTKHLPCDSMHWVHVVETFFSPFGFLIGELSSENVCILLNIQIIYLFIYLIRYLPVLSKWERTHYHLKERSASKRNNYNKIHLPNTHLISYILLWIRLWRTSSKQQQQKKEVFFTLSKWEGKETRLSIYLRHIFWAFGISMRLWIFVAGKNTKLETIYIRSKWNWTHQFTWYVKTQ